MRKIFKMLVIIIEIMILLNVLGLCDLKLYAEGTLIDVIEDPGAWEPSKKTSESQFDLQNQEFSSKMGTIAGAIQVIGIMVSVGSLSVIGIKFMLGSLEEKAQYKQTLAPWILGACMVFAMTAIPNIIYEIVTSDEVKSTVGAEYYEGYLTGYTSGMIFCKDWNGNEAMLETQKQYWNNYLRSNARANGQVDGALSALNHAGEKEFCEGYFKANLWVAGKDKEQIETQNSLISSGMGGIPTNQIPGYCQRLSLEIKKLEQKN